MAIDMPGRGNESIPFPSAPQSLMTHRNPIPPAETNNSRNRRAGPLSSACGSTHWYCVNPRRP